MKGNNGTTWLELVEEQTATSYSDTGLTQGQTRDYRVRAYNAAGNGPWEEVEATTHDAPAQVTGLTAVPGAGNPTREIDLSWDAPADNGSVITGYKIESSPDGTTFTELEADTGNTDTDYTAGSLSPDTTVHYRVSAINAIGTGTASDTVSGKTDTIKISFRVETAAGEEGAGEFVRVEASHAHTFPSRVTIPLTYTYHGGATSADHQVWPHILFDPDVAFEQIFQSILRDTEVDPGESIEIGFGALPAGFEAVAPLTMTITIHDRPGKVTDLEANAVSETRIDLSWTAAGSGGPRPIMLDWQRYRTDERRGAIDAASLALGVEEMRRLPGLANPAAGAN